MPDLKRKRLGDMLFEAGLITQAQLDRAAQIQKETGLLFGRVLVDYKFIEEIQIIELLERQLGIPRIVLDRYFVEPTAPLLISETLAKKYELVPVRKEGKKLIVAMTDPLNIFAIDDVQTATGLIVEPMIAMKADVSKAIGLYYDKQKAEKAIEDYYRENEAAQVSVETDDDSENYQNAPIVRFVSTIITQAVRNNASDIHIEPHEDEVIVRYRIDGNLQQMQSSAKSTHAAIVTRIKIMAKLDIAEKRQPQDGRIEAFVENSKLDLRISVIPTIFGEKIVIRLLYRNSALINKSNIGFSKNNLEVFNRIVKSPAGIILVTGPTGSGKSTTLYAVLEELNTPEKNIITVEDPVEYTIKGISQTQVNLKAGVNFTNSLSAILRQDPDVIMVGEIRDSETCELAIRAAITGHLVLSTIHTNDTASTITRLVEMGTQSFLVSTALVGVVAQRLVRKICPVCRQEIFYTREDLKEMRIEYSEDMRFYRGTGCPACRNTGYKGRTAVHEIMPVTRTVRGLISNSANADEIREASIKEGMTTLRQNCMELVTAGVTTLEEAMRVAYDIE